MKLRLYNKTLDPNLWDENQKLKPEIKDMLLKIANDFYTNTELKGDIQDILFLGSSANYTWTPVSDMDLHIVIDVAEQKITPDYARKFMDSLAAKWNNDHKIEIKGHPVELYLQDIGEPNSSPQLARDGVAIYSLVDDKWMVPPDPQAPKFDIEKIQKKYHKLAKEIEEIIQTQNVQKLKDLMKSIRNYRNAGLEKGGEFSTENIVFKALRRTGVLTKLKDSINTLYDRGVSLKESNIINLPKTPNWQAAIQKMTEWMENKVASGDLSFYFKNVTKFDPHEKKDALHILQFVEEMYKGGIRGFLADFNAGKLNEGVVDVDKYLIFGTTNSELHTIAKKVWKSGGADIHEKLMKEHPDFDRSDYDTIIHWIYKKRTNTLYYYGPITGDQRYVIISFLNHEYNVVAPKILRIVDWNMDAYTV